MMSTGDDWYNTDEINPFDDPSVTGVSSTTTAAYDNSNKNSNIQENHQSFSNPFATVASQTTLLSTPPLIINSNLNNGSINNNNTSNGESDRQKALLDREREILARERDLENQRLDLEERERKLGIDSTPREVNWPPFPSHWPYPLRPMLYHDISVDIPVENQPIMEKLYQLWMAICGCYLFNWISALVHVSCHTCSSNVSTVVIATVYLLIFPIASFRLWYLMIYNGFKKDRASNFLAFFFVFGFQVLADVFFAIGPVGSGGCGFFTAIGALSDSLLVAVFCFISGGLWTASGVMTVYIFMDVHKWYAGSDYTIDRVQGEMAREAATNETIRSSMTDSILKNMFN